MRKTLSILLTSAFILTQMAVYTAYADSVSTYLRKLNSSDDEDRETAAEQLSRYGTPKVVRALINALGDSSDSVAKRAAKSLGFIGDPDAVDPLIFLLRHSDSGVRGAAVEALGNIGDPQAIPALERVIQHDWNPLIKNLASESIDKCRANESRKRYKKKKTVVVTESEPKNTVPAGVVVGTPEPVEQPAQQAVIQTVPPSSETIVIKPQPESVPQGPLPKIAVLSFRDTASSGANVGFGDTISEMMTTSFITSQQFELIERAQIKKILEEQRFSVSGSVDSNTAIELGRLLGVEYILVGSVARLGNRFETDVRIIETKTGKGIIAESGSSDGEENLRTMVNAITDSLIRKYKSMPKVLAEKDNR